MSGKPSRFWDEYEALFDKITLGIIVGKGTEDIAYTDALKQMMLESNKLLFRSRKSDYFDTLYGRIERQLAAPQERSLISLCKQAPATAITQIENQIPHWIFAMKDTLSINTVRALALIVSDPAVEERVREEMSRADLTTAGGIDSLKYLEGCVQEAMRLWPTTQMLIRESLSDDTLGDVHVPAGTQVIIHNGFNHRDAETHDFADKFSPDIWLSKEVDFHFNHLSNGPQVCAGKDLALFIAKAVLATLLSKHRYRLVQPVLDPARPLPYVYDHYGIQLECMPGAS